MVARIHPVSPRFVFDIVTTIGFSTFHTFADLRQIVHALALFAMEEPTSDVYFTRSGTYMFCHHIKTVELVS